MKFFNFINNEHVIKLNLLHYHKQHFESNLKKKMKIKVLWEKIHPMGIEKDSSHLSEQMIIVLVSWFITPVTPPIFLSLNFQSRSLVTQWLITHILIELLKKKIDSCVTYECDLGEIDSEKTRVRLDLVIKIELN